MRSNIRFASAAMRSASVAPTMYACVPHGNASGATAQGLGFQVGLRNPKLHAPSALPPRP